MSDFFKIDTRPGKRGVTEIYPKFIVGKPNDLMIRGSDFYAIWMEERGLWSTDEQDVIRTIDRELRTYADEYQKTHDNGFHVLYMWDAESGMIDNWHKYCQRQIQKHHQCLPGLRVGQRRRWPDARSRLCDLLPEVREFQGAGDGRALQ